MDEQIGLHHSHILGNYVHILLSIIVYYQLKDPRGCLMLGKDIDGKEGSLQENVRTYMMDKENVTTAVASAITNHGIDDHITTIINWIIYTVACQVVEVFGIVTNIINIVCFVKQGLKDPVNVSLLGLAVSDLGCLVTMVWINISFTPAFSTAELPFDVLEVFYLAAAMPHATFSRISSWITAIITLERCLCIIAPLKVKDIITPRRVFLIIVVIFALLFCFGSPIYVVNSLGMKFSPERNRTLVGLVSTSDRESVEKMYFALNNFFLPFAAFIVIITCTAILVVSLQKRTKWRKTSMASTKADVSYRNQKVAKMVIMISTLFISCFVPISIVFLSLAFEPDLSIGGKLVNIGIVAGGFGVLLETINSSGNIFIYYYMSTKYRNVFRSIFCSVPVEPKI